LFPPWIPFYRESTIPERPCTRRYKVPHLTISNTGNYRTIKSSSHSETRRGAHSTHPHPPSLLKSSRAQTTSKGFRELSNENRQRRLHLIHSRVPRPHSERHSQKPRPLVPPVPRQAHRLRCRVATRGAPCISPSRRRITAQSNQTNTSKPAHRLFVSWQLGFIIPAFFTDSWVVLQAS
jgi:hypothetical protein